MPEIAHSAILKADCEIQIGADVAIMDYAVIGLANYYQDVFEDAIQRRVIIGARSRIYPWTLVYEGANLGTDVIMEERTSVGSRTTIGARSRVLYQAQINDKVTIGEECFIGGFIADNCMIGNRCSIFGALVHRYSNPSMHTWDDTDEPGPTIEDDVVVGWGAVIVGDVIIGEGARVLPLALVTENVAAGEKYGQRYRRPR